jgi:THO complex subunit 1
MKWVTEMRRRIENHITKDGAAEGAYFFRMVESILSRDKHWVRWKVENCPPIELKSITADGFLDAKKTLHRTTISKRARLGQVGSLALNFLSDSDEQVLMERLKASERYELPDLKALQYKISDDDFDIEGAKDAKSKALATDKKASKSWRALRIASRTKLAQFDKIDNPDKIDAIFEEAAEADEAETADDESGGGEPPQDTRPVVISGPAGVGKTALANAMMAKHRGVFAKVIRHTSRERREGEVDGKDFFFVTSQAFNIMLDGDQFVEFKDFDGYGAGTNKKTVEAINDGGKVALMEMDREVRWEIPQPPPRPGSVVSNNTMQAAQMVKEMGFEARFILIKPPSSAVLAQRATASGQDEAAVEELVKATEAEGADVEGEELFDTIIINDDLEAATLAVEGYIFGGGLSGEDSASGTEDGDCIVVATTSNGIGA